MVINDLIPNMKTLFVKSHKRAQLFKETNPGVPLPPQPVITRWGTWLDAVMCYFKYWKETNNILSLLNNKDNVAVKKAKTALKLSKTKCAITTIATYFGFLIKQLKSLQSGFCHLSDT